MARIQIQTDDERLRRLLSLLILELGHEASDTAPSLIVTDKSDIGSPSSSVPILLIGAGGIPRPFSHAALKARIEELLSASPLPIFTPTEERLYRALKDASPNFVSREALVRAVFGEGEDGGKLNLYIHYLRKKIETDGKKRIFVCRGKGYRLSC